MTATAETASFPGRKEKTGEQVQHWQDFMRIEVENGGVFLRPLKNRQDVSVKIKSCMNYVAAGIVILTRGVR